MPKEDIGSAPPWSLSQLQGYVDRRYAGGGWTVGTVTEGFGYEDSVGKIPWEYDINNINI